MPHIRIRSLSAEQVQELSPLLSQELAKIMGTSEENFSIELIATQFYAQKKPVQADPMIEVLWFDRGQEIQDRAAAKINELVQSVSDASYIAVVFTGLDPRSYYENGKHF